MAVIISIELLPGNYNPSSWFRYVDLLQAFLKRIGFTAKTRPLNTRRLLNTQIHLISVNRRKLIRDLNLFP